MTTFPLQTKIYTVEDLENLSNEDGAKYELYDGELTLMPPSQRNATELGVEIASLLRNFTRGKGFGYIAGADGGYILSREPDTFVSPDGSFISKERAGERKSTGYYPVAPDLAVEVISPSDRAADIRRKIDLYLQHGTRLIWVVYPQTRTIEVHTSIGSRNLTVEDALEGGEVLPGFNASIRDIFNLLDE